MYGERIYGVFHANIFDHLPPPGVKVRPYGQPGQLPNGNDVALLIELKAQIL